MTEMSCAATQEAVRERELTSGEIGCPLCGMPAGRHVPERVLRPGIERVELPGRHTTSSKGPPREPGLLRMITANEHTAAGPLTEDEFYGAMAAALRHRPGPRGIMVSQRVIDRARADAERLRVECQSLYMRHRRLPWWAWIRRRRLAESFMEKRTFADSLEATFGRG